MRDLVIKTILENLFDRGLDEGFFLWDTTTDTQSGFQNPLSENPEVIKAFLESLTDNQLLDVLKRQHCLQFR